MYELVQINDNDYYINCPAKIGLVKVGDNEVILIDSGNDKNAGRKIRQILDREGWNLKAIYNTHSHADHIGGNRYLQNQKNCKIYIPEIEKDFTVHPILESSFLFGGYPMKDLRHKFLLAQDSNAEELTKEALPKGFEIIELPGHSFNMVGFRTPDNTIYLADVLTSKSTLDKYGISFLYDVESYLDSLEKIKKLEAEVFVPAHAEVSSDILELADYNIEKTKEVADRILEYCKEAHTFEEILQYLFNSYDLLLNLEQYALVGSTIRSYLSWLKNNNKLETFVEDNKLYWKTQN